MPPGKVRIDGATPMYWFIIFSRYKSPPLSEFAPSTFTTAYLCALLWSNTAAKKTNLAALLKCWIEKTLRGTNDPSISHQRGSWENQRLKEVPLGREMWTFPEGYNAYKSDKSLWAGSAALHHLGVHPDSSLNSSTDPLHSLELTTRTWKSMVGKRKFLFGMAHFQRLWLLVLGSNKSNRSLFSVSQNVEKKPSIFIAPNFV